MNSNKFNLTFEQDWKLSELEQKISELVATIKELKRIDYKYFVINTYPRKRTLGDEYIALLEDKLRSLQANAYRTMKGER